MTIPTGRPTPLGRGVAIVAQLLPIPSQTTTTSRAALGTPTPLPGAAAYRAALIERHLPLVHHVARQLGSAARRCGIVDYNDLVSYGVEGLVAALDSFDPTRDVRFSTWAVLHIRTTILDALRSLDSLTPAMRRRGAQIEQTRTTLAHQQGAVPTDAAVGAALDLSVAQVRRCRQQTSVVSVSLDEVNEDRADGFGRAWLDALADEDSAGDPAAVADQAALRQLLSEALATLPERERTVIVAHFVGGQRFREIAGQLGVSETRVSQIRNRALQRLRVHMTAALGLAEGERVAA